MLMPAGILTIALAYIIITKNRTKARKVAIATLVFFYFFSNPFVVNELLLLWEVPPTQISNLQKHDIGVILTGGITNDDKQPIENLYVGTTADRAFQALNLYKKKKIEKILICGGNSRLAGKNLRQECDDIAQYLMISGVSAKDIFIERTSRNTRENAINASKILKKQFPNQSIVLISSAFHLRRAKACFEKVGLSPTFWGANYLTHESQIYLTSFVPKEDSLYFSYLLFREIIGLITYRLMGYV